MTKTNKNLMDIHPKEKHTFLSLISRIKKAPHTHRYERRKVKQYLSRYIWAET
ncbi:MAG: hypothetical protein NZM04_01600 [Methylacidiphilales bacterium]|nr:hypothetical protein [Candidatus Methylacidiphilales bacterium]MDW8349001.1 hypothetical protein [Verrucomicrobiae bacterium]